MKVHETELDAVNEERIMKAWAEAHWKDSGKAVEKLYHTGRYKLDYALYYKGGELAGMVEVKKRNKFYNTIIMDLSKALEMDSYFCCDLQMIFLIEVPEGIFHYKWTTLSNQLILKARHHISNDDPTDNGPVIDIPKNEFIKLSAVSK